jgi:hypothetical protein
MSVKYKFRDQDQLCNFAVVNWIDLFIPQASGRVAVYKLPYNLR